METNEIMTNEAVTEVTEEIVTTVSSNESVMKTVAKVGGTAAIVGGAIYLGYKYVVKPLAAKMKAKNEQPEEAVVCDDCEEACDVDNVEDNE